MPGFSVFLTNYMATAALHDLHLAVRTNREDLVKYILKTNEKLNINSRLLKTTVLSLAVQQKSAKIVELLIEWQADPNTISCDQSGRLEPPLFTACRLNQLEIAKILIKHGANTNATDFYHHTPLWASVKERNVDLCELLIANGANLNQGDKSGQCALNLALKYSSGREYIAKLLISHGANVDFADSKGRNSLDFAICSRNSNIIYALLQAGAAVSSETRKQCYIAERCNDNPCLLIVSNYLRVPRTLRAICTIQVRTNLTKISQSLSVWPNIEKLCLPDTLKDTLMMKQ